MEIIIRREKPTGTELCALYDAVGWEGNQPESLGISIAAYPCTLTVRNEDGTLIGYLSAFSDEVSTTMIGELIVHPMHQRTGIGSALLRRLREQYPRPSIYANVLPAAKEFFHANGFLEPSIGLAVMVAKQHPPSK
ncbi:MAG: GNAT family N-acetyltransferase [Ignavibacteria bacterium]|nr:GNAT family N-acetyltransferase [Ignavibacteria bacterium]